LFEGDHQIAPMEKVEPQQNEQIRVTKDIAVVAAGLSILVWGAVLTIEIIRLVQIQ
jgi:hypothetical protein